MVRIEFENAFYWKCPDCNSDNYTRGIIPSIDSEQDREFIKQACIEFDISDVSEDVTDEDIEGLILIPEKVSCKNCKKEFDSRQDDE